MQKDDISLPLRYDVLKRNKRIQGKTRVSEALDKGSSTSNSFFVLRKKANGLPANCYAVLIGKKLEKSAVKRNRMRRRAYEIIRLLEKDALVPNTPPSDIVLIARRPVQNASFDEIQKALRSLLHSPKASLKIDLP